MTSHPVRLSTVIPNFNHGHEIAHAIDAVAAQVPAPDEIIVVDDGSTDDSVQILHALQAKYPSLRIIRLDKNQGVIAALNRGLQEARGAYVNFGAADDVVRPGLYAATLALLDEYPDSAFASCECELLDLGSGTSSVRPPVRPSQTPRCFDPAQVERLLRSSDNWILTGTAVIRRELLLAAGGFDASLAAFTDGYVLRKLALTHGFCFAPHVGLTWRVAASGYSRSLAANPEAIEKVLNVSLDRMRADPAFPRWYLPLFARRWRFGMGRIAIGSQPMNIVVLQHLWRDPVSRVVLAAAPSLGSFGRFALLAWITIRERPTSLIGMVCTLLMRHIEVAGRKTASTR